MISQRSSHGRKRDKPVLSCSFCRTRKLRCDRQSPCSSCLRRGKLEECKYSSSEQERKYAVDYRPHSGSKHARERVAHLEKLLTQMRDQTRVMEQSSLETSGILASSPEPFHDSASRLAPRNGHVADTVGKLTVSDDHAVYIGSTHWVTILEEIQILKDELSDDHSEAVRSRESTIFDAPTDETAPATRISLLSSHPSLTKEHILAMMPPRRYSNFWENPSAAPIMWVGLLFSVMGISAFVQQQDVASPYAAETQEMLKTYRTLTIHCLVAGDYLRPNRYTIQTLALQFAVDQSMNLNTDTGNWILIGVIIRLALRMGLYRDPSHWPNVRPLEAEFRRRLWITLYHMDFFTSARVGLPRIIKDSQCDTRPPANLFEDDLSLEHDEVPAERPLTDPSPLSHIIQRHTIVKVAAEIYDATEARLPPSATIAMLGAKLERAIDSIPEQSKHRSLETSVADNPATILHRMFMDILINKAVCLLHRWSFMKGSAEEESTRSSKLCINAALIILEHQRKMSEETQPGGIMFGVRWRVASSLNHEFLQATMMLCFALSRFHEGHVSQSQSGAFHRRDEILEALTIAKSLWEKDADRSAEANRAAKAITSVLKQDFDKSSLPTLIPSDGAEHTQMREHSATIDHPTGFREQGYLGGYHSEQNMTGDPPFSAIDDMVTFGSLWEDFVAEPIEGNWAGMY
ncbi:Oleate activated transcription factor 3 [Talaromyces islandicus]|uniref:Oleate activated transcription factor 3 n=1 Tax=Talaromyces islandicus TaxID=28573 RepID=A0A0U1M0X6_TALIS|nr:Oleate activated transcription factor 3 [Talaromyces islandicus]